MGAKKKAAKRQRRRSSGPTLRQRLRLVAIAGKVTVAKDRRQHGYAQRRAFIVQ